MQLSFYIKAEKGFVTNKYHHLRQISSTGAKSKAAHSGCAGRFPLDGGLVN